MTEDKLEDEYLNWMYDTVCDDRYSKRNTYRTLFLHLYETEFFYTIPMDGNRYEDGVNLRYNFGHDRGYPEYVIASYLDNKPCSVLEMMIALSIRCETHIMDNPDLGNRVGQWFWEMIVSLGLGHMTDDNFDEAYVDMVMDRFMNHDYDRDGRGGLFTIEDPTKDMRTMEIWYQMCWHLDEIWKEEL